MDLKGFFFFSFSIYMSFCVCCECFKCEDFTYSGGGSVEYGSKRFIIIIYIKIQYFYVCVCLVNVLDMRIL